MAESLNEVDQQNHVRLLRDAEHHLDVHNFQHLYEAAVDACLRVRPTIEKKLDIENNDQQLIRRIGVKGLGLALDIVHEPYRFLFLDTVNELGQPLITDSLPVREPEICGGRRDAEVVEHIKAFGQQLLEEAYLSLGTDVGEHLARFQAAATDEEQIQELMWLHERVKAMADTKRIAGAEWDTSFYHPIRLSPKAMGTYPHHRAAPTCLSVSILTASFVHKTGAPTLHAGVMQTGDETDIEDFAVLCEALAQSDIAPLPTTLRERLTAKYDELVGTAPDNGFHAATLVKLLSGNWFVLDPNFDASYALMSETKAASVTKAQEEIKEFSELAPGMELSVDIGYRSYPYYIAEAIYGLKKDKTSQSTVDDLLSPEDIEDFRPNIRRFVRKSIMSFKTSSPKLYKKIVKDMLRAETLYASTHNDTVFDKALSVTMDSMFLYDESPQDIIERARSDNSYRARRIEDLRALPYMTLLNCVKTVVDLRRSDYFVDSSALKHGYMEVGDPAYRIGASVLSDFAVYTGDDLSYSFWTAHWPGRVAITEHMNQGETEADDGVLKNNLIWLSYVLKYNKQNGIVTKFKSAI